MPHTHWYSPYTAIHHCRFPRVQFDYQDPSRNFNRDKVKGPVAKLIRLKDLSTATALEVTAGGKVSLRPYIWGSFDQGCIYEEGM